MLTGALPFKTEHAWETMQLIMNAELNFPSHIEPEAMDIIKQLLKKEPDQRLGAGVKGSKNDFKALKSHPFFKGIDFSSIHYQHPPVASSPNINHKITSPTQGNHSSTTVSEQKEGTSQKSFLRYSEVFGA